MALQKKPAGSQSKPTPRPTPQPGPDEHEEEEHSNTPRSKADAFNNATPEAGINLPPGNYTAHLVGASHEVEGQKESVKVQYEVYDGEHAGQVVPAWYNLFDKHGEAQRGIGFLKRDFEIMGRPPLDYDNLSEQLQELEAERLLCNITVKKNGQYTNLYFQGLAEGS